MRLIDSHCHLTHNRLRRDLDGVLQRARAAGVVACICASSDLEESRASRALAAQHDWIYFTAGTHPHSAKEVVGDHLAQLEMLAADGRCVAVGEIGLDYHYDFSPRDVQRRVFAEQLELAKRLGKKVVVHTREAFDDTLAILIESGVPGDRIVLHSCTESAANISKALGFGTSIGFSGIVTFSKTGDLRAASLLVPDDRLLIETDAPFLSPEPVRNMKHNEPANVAHIAACLAAVRGIQAEAFAEMTTANAARFFGLDISSGLA